jgi:hypothetical protein
MPIGERRKGHVGIFSTTVLMVSVVLFIGSLFYLTTNNPWSSGSTFGGKKYVTTSISDKQPEIQQFDQKELNLTTAVADLESAGCVFTVYTGEYTASKGIRLEYNKFREEAINRKIVYIAEVEQDTTVLLLEKKGQIFEWRP